MKTKPFAKLFGGLLAGGLLLAGLMPLIAQDGPSSPNPPKQPENTDEDALPKYEDLKVPTVKQLLLEPPKDWIRLKKTDEVIICEPVYPRPNTIEKLEKEREKLSQNRPVGDKALEEWRKKRFDLNYLNVILPDAGDAPEFRLALEDIEEIIYHEELLLRRVDLLIKEGDQRKAFELLYQLERRLPNWPGIEDRKNYLLFMQAEGYREKKQFESALVFFEQLHQRKPDYPELKTRLGEVADVLVEDAVDAEDFRQARHYLGRLRRMEPDHTIVKKWRTELTNRASKVMDQAKAATAEGKHDVAATLAKEAISIWPDASNLRSDYITAWRRFQRLHAGVMQLAGQPTEFFLPTAADQREEYLTRTKLFSVSQSQGRPRYHSRYIEQWEPEDLGRRAVFHLRTGCFSWEARPPATATDIVNTFDQLLDPSHELYDERLASYLETITVKTPAELELKFSRVPLRTEALLDFPLRRTEFEAKQYQGPADLADIYSERFLPVERGKTFNRYRRAIPQSEESGQFYVAEVQEHQYESHEEAIRDLLRGKIDMIPRARIWHVDPLIKSNQFFVLKQDLPRVHVLQFNPKSKALRNREFRRALVHSIDKKRILHENILQGADARHAKLVTAPYDRDSYAYNTLVEPREYNLVLSVALRLASQKALGGQIPELKMVCDPDPPIVAAAENMIANWKRVGIPVKLVNNTGQLVSQDSEAWDIVYRTGMMAEPLTELWPFLTMQSRARIADLEHLPDWLRQELIALDTANDWKTAIDQLRRLHRLLQAEVQLIPLWQVDEYAVYRRHLEGFRQHPMYPYQDIDHWTVGAWIPPESP